MSDNHWKVSIEEEFNKNPNLKKEDIESIKKWLSGQEHLPKIADHSIVMFLHATRFDVNRTQEVIDLHFTYRTLMKDIFTERDPDGEDIQKIMTCCRTVILPEKDNQGNYILWSNMFDSDLKKFKFASAGKLNIMTSDVLQLNEGTIPGVVYVYDVKNMGLSHLLSTPIKVLRHYVIYGQESSPFPVKAIHFINTNPVMDKLINLVKPLIKSHVWKIQFFHSNMETLYQHIPKEVIPEEYGGNAPHTSELAEKNLEEMRKYREWFLEEETIRVDESKRIDKKKSEQLANNFKKMELD
ncbi:clavesin-1 [Nilaparvata lugens]|uniref:clavesin-1 n=1 Tax=Nilaparvata lugens TaxID=108931 RepID=UPI00193CF445|nr:clavesin-1 [Nilaparvata lugens]XP_039291895.1 clavesin-1 [Nilaparvata lugens]XP_039291896.1 clavesin-1 [Nilaparvata lugens]XP_039291897.1 clavesin-1 [Nilaparvata lugens]